MKYLKIIMFIMLFMLQVSSGAQVVYEDISVTIERLFNRIRLDIPEEKKQQANDSIRAFISMYASSDSVFSHNFTNIRYLGQITSPDSLVKLLTWNLVLPDGTGKYHCFIVSRNKKKEKPSVGWLEARYSDRPPLAKRFTSADWYGALYYDIRPFSYGGKLLYIVLGIDYGNKYITRKYIDILDISDAANPVFGLDCFSDGRNIKNRIVFEYSSSAIMSLRFETATNIVFDHLSPFSPEFSGNFQFYGPDFTFDSYNFENGLWRLKTDINIKNKERR